MPEPGPPAEFIAEPELVAFGANASVYPPPPPDGWLTGPVDAILTICGQALDGQPGLGELFPRRAVVHGQPKPNPSVQGHNGQLYVWTVALHPGEAGAEQFRWTMGSPGQVARRTLMVAVELWAAYTAPYKGLRAATPSETGTGAELLLTALAAVWAALQATELGGWTADGLDPVRRAQQILVGRADPLGPGGNMAGWRVPVAVQV